MSISRKLDAATRPEDWDKLKYWERFKHARISDLLNTDGIQQIRSPSNRFDLRLKITKSSTCMLMPSVKNKSSRTLFAVRES